MEGSRRGGDAGTRSRGAASAGCFGIGAPTAATASGVGVAGIGVSGEGDKTATRGALFTVAFVADCAAGVCVTGARATDVGRGCDTLGGVTGRSHQPSTNAFNSKAPPINHPSPRRRRSGSSCTLANRGT